MNETTLKKKWLEQDEGQIDLAVSALLEHEHGRRFLWWLLERGRVGQQPFSNNALQTAFACGELNVGQQVLDRITTVSPQGYVNMMKEQADEYRTRADALANTRSGNSAGGDTADTESDANS